MFKWPVVPICKNQLKDIDYKNLLKGGLYRKCDILKSGDSYDRFNHIYYKRFKETVNPVQFVVQLRGCPLSCDYCYVTKKGVWGNPIYVKTETLIKDYKKTKLDVFHLMGGAPALYLSQWKLLAYKVKIFHSDFILLEGKYNIDDLINLPGLYAVNFKDFINPNWKNFEIIIESGINFYITFTGRPIYKSYIKKRYGKKVLEDSFTININYKYKALENAN